MTDREPYAPGPARGAEVRKDGEKWTLVLVRELRHSPKRVWQALTDPAHLREWAPFDADGSLGTAGTTVKLTTVGAPTPQVSETKVTRADAPNVLEYKWGGFDLPEEFDRAKRHVLGSTVLSLEDPGSRMSRLGKSEVAHGEILTLDETLARVRAVSLADANEVAERVLSQPMTLAVVGPKSMKGLRGVKA